MIESVLRRLSNLCLIPGSPSKWRWANPYGGIWGHLEENQASYETDIRRAESPLRTGVICPMAGLLAGIIVTWTDAIVGRVRGRLLD